ncbi:uncharacterized protein EAE98_001955 [Botrytis deweyae]|uniref:Uncharacterized protein n=1 Tax=Botrytis deweyae TaxID=2478750 RepID=A0ABQ7IZB4_9HELO|nr:uncharacterized protein EAE98_001955 [Botrytis deweyae]KAF7937641.1 hypothetical protein EAE98_001955 [Botrytis deweyae]
MYSNVGPLHADSMDRLLAQDVPSPRGFAAIRVKIGRLRAISFQTALATSPSEYLNNCHPTITQPRSRGGSSNQFGICLFKETSEIICIMRPPEHWQ